MSNNLLILDGITESEYKQSISYLPGPHQRELVKAWRAKAKGLEVADPFTEPAEPTITPTSPEPTPAPVAAVEAPEKPKQHYTPAGRLTPWNCTLAGCEHIRVWFDTSQLFDVVDTTNNTAIYRIQKLLDRAVKDDDGFGDVRRMMVLCPRIEFNEVDPLSGESVPDALCPDMESYGYIPRFPGLAEWLLYQGWKEALEGQALPNS